LPQHDGHAEFLLEIGCEEIPAGMIEPACAELKALLERFLGEASLLEGSAVESFGGPRRLTAIVPALRLKQADAVKEITGPPKATAYDAQGQPTRAAEGFAANKGVRVEDLYIIQLPKGEFVAARQVTPGRHAAEVLAEALPQIIAEIRWPKTMRWSGSAGPRFIRPVRWIVSLLDGKVVPFQFGEVPSGKLTSGHRFLGKQGIAVRNAADYFASLRKNFVLVDPRDRGEKISSEIAALVSRAGMRVHPDPDLQYLVTYLNEYPTAILGEFDRGFLELPEEILVTVMRDHQKYFAVQRPQGGLAPHFIAVINSAGDTRGAIRAGHERVLRARFADARFFWASDQVKCRLADNGARLDSVLYESSLGSYGLKVARMRDLAGAMAGALAAAFRDLAARKLISLPSEQSFAELSRDTIDRAALLSKCDLVTEMVREFPELQGVVGGLYARAQGESESVAMAIYDHYRPAGLEDAIPRSLTSCVLALSDKLDTFVGCFAAGKIPSGSSDPFALRRAASGVIKIIVERRLPISLPGAVQATLVVLEKHNPGVVQSPELPRQIMDFLAERTRFYSQEKLGFAYDEVKAAMAAGWDDLADLIDRLRALRDIRRTENFAPLASAFKRIRNILEKSAAGVRISESLEPAGLVAEEERALYDQAERVAGLAGGLREEKRYQEALELIASLRPAVDRFFDNVLVMADDEAVRKNRLALLGNLLREFSTIADFSEIVTETPAPPKKVK
jgi:glycyl-tRNA synthetase beta chain